MDALTGLSGGGRSSLIMSVYLTSDQSPLCDATPSVVRSVRPVRGQGSRGGVWCVG